MTPADLPALQRKMFASGLSARGRRVVCRWIRHYAILDVPPRVLSGRPDPGPELTVCDLAAVRDCGPVTLRELLAWLASLGLAPAATCCPSHEGRSDDD